LSPDQGYFSPFGVCSKCVPWSLCLTWAHDREVYVSGRTLSPNL
jgi:hypothetical protein